MRERVKNQIIPALRAFRPEIILLAAGFDGHQQDPLANLCFNVADYAWLAKQMLSTADELCGGRLVASLEGGYDLHSLDASSGAFVHEMLSHRREAHG